MMRKVLIALMLMSAPAFAQAEQGMQYEGGFGCKTVDEAMGTGGHDRQCKPLGKGIYLVKRKIETRDFDFSCIRPVDGEALKRFVLNEPEGFVQPDCLWVKKLVWPKRS